MMERTVSSVDELHSVLEAIGPGAVYRGQTKHYGAAGAPSALTSFSRLGCIPSEMLKWTHYAYDVLRYWFGSKADERDFTQAILQHYGWRSFYLDVSESAAVSSWFASHTYKKRDRLELCEDCDEVGIFLQINGASYEFEEGLGHLYIIEKNSITAPVRLIELSEVEIHNRRPRFIAQQACLLGPLHDKPLPQEYYHTHIVADRAIFREYAAIHGLTTTATLFPGRSIDPILNSLLSLPWVRIQVPIGEKEKWQMRFFRRAIDIPEYEDNFTKIQPANVAFYENVSIAAANILVDGIPEKNIVLPASETAFFGTTKPQSSFPKIECLVRKYGCVSFEVDQLIRHVPSERTCLYGKGVSIAKRGDDLIEIGELLVEHPGLRLTRAGMNAGRHYKITADGVWERHKHPNDCACGNDETHVRHLFVLTILEEQLNNPE